MFLPDCHKKKAPKTNPGFKGCSITTWLKWFANRLWDLDGSPVPWWHTAHVPHRCTALYLHLTDCLARILKGNWHICFISYRTWCHQMRWFLLNINTLECCWKIRCATSPPLWICWRLWFDCPWIPLFTVWDSYLLGVLLVCYRATAFSRSNQEMQLWPFTTFMYL